VGEVLVVTWDGGGNVPPALGIAGELVRRGHRVRFLGHERQRSSVEEAGFGFEAYRHARPYSAIEPLPTPKAIVAIFGMFTDGGPGVDLRELFGRQPADLLVIDGMSLGALKAAYGLSVPVVALMHIYHQFFVKRWARDLSVSWGPSVDAHRSGSGHEPPVSWWPRLVILIRRRIRYRVT
jgi:hypothetical protein